VNRDQAPRPAAAPLKAFLMYRRRGDGHRDHRHCYLLERWPVAKTVTVAFDPDKASTPLD